MRMRIIRCRMKRVLRRPMARVGMTVFLLKMRRSERLGTRLRGQTNRSRILLVNPLRRLHRIPLVSQFRQTSRIQLAKESHLPNKILSAEGNVLFSQTRLAIQKYLTTHLTRSMRGIHLLSQVFSVKHPVHSPRRHLTSRTCSLQESHPLNPTHLVNQTHPKNQPRLDRGSNLLSQIPSVMQKHLKGQVHSQIETYSHILTRSGYISALRPKSAHLLNRNLQINESRR